MAKKSLLLVDGDPRSQKLLEISLRKSGFSVTTAVNGTDALEKADLAVPDLIISDTKMPGLDGFQFCEKVKSDPKFKGVPFIFLTAEKSIENKIRGLELGVDDYLTKPIYMKEVVTRVRILIEKRDKEALERRDRSSFGGYLGDMGVVDLLQTIDIGRKTGVLNLSNGPQTGRIYFRKGKVIDAQVGKLQGEHAVYRFLIWNDGEFSLEFVDHDRGENIQLSTQGLLMEGMRRVDEWGRMLEQVPPLESRFDIDYNEFASRLAEIPDEVNAILRLFDGDRTLMEVIDVSDFGDLEALNLISKLFFEGLIYDVSSASAGDADFERPSSWLDAPPAPAAPPHQPTATANGPVAARPEGPEAQVSATPADAAAVADALPPSSSTQPMGVARVQPSSPATASAGDSAETTSDQEQVKASHTSAPAPGGVPATEVAATWRQTTQTLGSDTPIPRAEPSTVEARVDDWLAQDAASPAAASTHPTAPPEERSATTKLDTQQPLTLFGPEPSGEQSIAEWLSQPLAGDEEEGGSTALVSAEHEQTKAASPTSAQDGSRAVPVATPPATADALSTPAPSGSRTGAGEEPSAANPVLLDQVSPRARRDDSAGTHEEDPFALPDERDAALATRLNSWLEEPLFDSMTPQPAAADTLPDGPLDPIPLTRRATKSQLPAVEDGLESTWDDVVAPLSEEELNADVQRQATQQLPVFSRAELASLQAEASTDQVATKGTEDVLQSLERPAIDNVNDVDVVDEIDPDDVELALRSLEPAEVAEPQSSTTQAAAAQTAAAPSDAATISTRTDAAASQSDAPAARLAEAISSAIGALPSPDGQVEESEIAGADPDHPTDPEVVAVAGARTGSEELVAAIAEEIAKRDEGQTAESVDALDVVDEVATDDRAEDSFFAPRSGPERTRGASPSTLSAQGMPPLLPAAPPAVNARGTGGSTWPRVAALALVLGGVGAVAGYFGLQQVRGGPTAVSANTATSLSPTTLADAGTTADGAAVAADAAVPRPLDRPDATTAALGKPADTGLDQPAEVKAAAAPLDLADSDNAAASPEDAEARQSPRARFQQLVRRGRALSERGRLRPAIAAYRQALKLEPDSAVVHTALANAYYELDELANAERHLDKAIAADKNYAAAFVLRGTVYQTLNRIPEAIRAYERYLQLAPKGSFARDVREVVNRLKQGR